MAERDRRPATYADLEAVPSNMIGEIINGRVVTRPVAAPEEVAVRDALLRILTGPSEDGPSQLSTTEPSQSGG